MWWFLLGLGLGVLIGFFIFSLFSTASDDDDDMSDPVMQKLASKYQDH